MMLASLGLLLLQGAQYSAAYPSLANGEDQSAGLGPRADGFCAGNGASWDATLWTDNDVGTFLNNRLGYYSGQGGSWPTEEGVPRAIAENGADNDNLYNWGTACRSASSTCDLDETQLTDPPECPDNWKRAFSLWAMRNSARFVQKYYAAITDVFDTSSLSIAKIVDTFTEKGDEDTELGTSSWLIIMSGVISASTAFIPGIGAAAGGAVSGVLGIGVGILSGVQEAAEDPRFTTFADLENRLGDIKIQTQNSIDAYFNRLWRDTPPAGDVPAGKELGALLETGVWAEQDMAELDYTKEDMVRMIHSGIISEAWNSQHVVIMKWSKNKLSDVRGNHYDPCYGKPIEDLDEWVACANDRNYVFAHVPHNSGTPWIYLGFTEAALQEFGLNHQLVIDAAEKRQGATGVWISRDLEFLSGDLSDMAQDPPDNPADELVQFNIPVCDLDGIEEIEWTDSMCIGDVGCMSSVLLDNCPKLILNGAPFPYEKTIGN